jgi:hypothetical protein
VCSLSGSNKQMRLVGTFKRIVVVLHMLKLLFLVPKKSAADSVCIRTLFILISNVFASEIFFIF